MKELSQNDYEAVKYVMLRHCGEAKAITLNALAARAGLLKPNGKPDRRRAEIILQTCADDFPFIIVGSSKGMYIATCPDDLNHEIKSRQSRIKNIQLGIRSKKQKALSLGWKIEGDTFTDCPKQQELAL